MNKKIVLAGFIVLGGYLVLEMSKTLDVDENMNSENADLQMNSIKKQRQKNNLDKLITYAKSAEKFQNKDVVDLLGVSEKTARNYCAQLLSKRIIKKYGTTGRSVYYSYHK